MSETAEKLMPSLRALSPEDRAYIAHRLLETLDEEEEDAEFVADLNRRVEEIMSGKVQGIPAEEVHRQARERYS